MPPQQQHPALDVVDDDAARRLRHPKDVMLEPSAALAGNLDVDERQPNPFAVVQGPLTMQRPAHASTV